MKWISTTGLLVALCLASGQAMAQPGAIGQSFDDLSTRLEQQDQQIRQLQSQLNAVQAQQQQQGTPATPAAYAPGDDQLVKGRGARRARAGFGRRWRCFCEVAFQPPFCANRHLRGTISLNHQIWRNGAVCGLRWRERWSGSFVLTGRAIYEANSPREFSPAH